MSQLSGPKVGLAPILLKPAADTVLEGFEQLEEPILNCSLAKDWWALAEKELKVL